MAAWIVNGPGASYSIPPVLRRRLLRWSGAGIGGARILAGGTFRGDLTNLTIGDGVFINTGVSIFPTGGVAIGDNVHFGPNCTVMTGSHTIGGSRQRAASPTQYAPVVIGSGTWLGAAVTVCPGVTIEEGCVVATGAVVVDDLQANGLYAGVPARLKRRLPPDAGEDGRSVEAMEVVATGDKQ
ncbi:acyltransferase [Gordonia amicalis]|nr:acyltransferase [Gordonia amicalis]